MEGIRAAVNAGADAVYAGGRAFGARAYAQNPQQDALLEAIDYCHLHGAKLYLTVNTLLKEKELQEQLYEYLAPVCEHGVDAVLVQDFGVFHFLRREFPDLPLHASTQMTITGVDGVRLLKEMGAQRVVLSRELSLEEIRKIRRSVDVELETFVHGALCYCYSGQCLMSSLIGGRSGNRGRCAQPCRLPYELYEESPVNKTDRTGRQKTQVQPEVYGRDPAWNTMHGRSLSRKGETFLLSPKDICTLQILPDLIDAGIASLKIEGRMKSPEYAAGVTAMYRRYVDLYLENGRDGYRVDPEDEKILTQLFSRGPYSEGYYFRRNGREMMVLREQVKEKGDALRASQEAVARIHDCYEKTPDIPVRGYARICAGKEMSLQVSLPEPENCSDYLKSTERSEINGCRETFVTAYGAVPSAAQNRPMDQESVRKQLMKTGDSPFSFESLDIDLEDGLFVPLKELNVLRRSALEMLKDKILAGYRRAPASDLTAADASAKRTSAKQPSAVELPGHTDAVESCDHTDAEEPVVRGGADHPSETASVCTMPQLDAVLESDRIGGVYLDLPVCNVQTVRRVQESGRKAYIMMPPVWRADTVRVFEKTVDPELAKMADGYLLRSFDQIRYLLAGSDNRDNRIPGSADHDRRIEPDRRQEFIADAGLYTWNSEARLQLREFGITTDTVPFECTMHELSQRGCAGSECVIYGHQVLMISAQCLTKTTTGCTHKRGIRWLKDRKGVYFPVRNECGICTNYIYNSVPLDLVSLKSETDRLGLGSVRYSFTIETGEQTSAVLRGELPENITRGHFRKGVE
ncbi:MAG: U32 family peptidase [Lachnospiraceae bacterium]|nr:U32 family peptidase [Lachnospiraceae bacterium]